MKENLKNIALTYCLIRIVAFYQCLKCSKLLPNCYIQHFRDKHSELLKKEKLVKSTCEFCQFCGKILKQDFTKHRKTCMQYMSKVDYRNRKCLICLRNCKNFIVHFEKFHPKKLRNVPRPEAHTQLPPFLNSHSLELHPGWLAPPFG